MSIVLAHRTVLPRHLYSPPPPAIRTTAVELSLPTDRAGDLRRAVPGPATDAALAAGTIEEGRLHIDLPMEGAEIAASQLVTVIGVEVQEPPDLGQSSAIEGGIWRCAATDEYGVRSCATPSCS